MLAVTSITFFFVADVKCGLYEMNKNNRANATRGLSLVQKMFPDQTEVTFDWRSPGPGPVLTVKLHNKSKNLKLKHFPMECSLCLILGAR